MSRALRATRTDRWPALLKPDQGGSGARIQVVESLAQVEAIFAADPAVWLPDNLFLLQEYLPHDPDQGIVRLEFLGGELLYAMRVKTHGRFNLCPSPVCNPDEGSGVCEVPAHAAPAPPGRVLSVSRGAARSRRHGAPDRAAAQARRRRHRVSRDADGRRVFYDINANSNLRPSVAAAFGFDPFERVVDFSVAQLSETSRRR